MAKRERISLPDVTAAFRTLANEHARKRANSERPVAWQLIRGRLATRRDALWPAARAGFLHVALPLAAAVALGIVAFRGGSELRYEVRGASLVDGALRTESQNAVINFSDGSRVEMLKGTTSKIEIAGSHAARARLTSGEMMVSVQHRRDTDYRFLAGPYEVRVIGTKFHLSWQPASGLFSVAMQEGRVRVLGPGAFDRAVSAGQTLRLSAAEQPLASAAPQVAPNPEPSSATGARAPLAATLAGASSAPAPAAASAFADSDARAQPTLGKVEGLTWPEQVAKGQFAQVVSAAVGEGTERVLRERNASEVSALAHAAHYTGRTALAVAAWTSLRERFPGRKSARQAAFFLGRVYDQQGRAGEALRWLNAYLSEASGDVYTSEALGRKLAVVRRLSGVSAARPIAQDYLARYPKGAYAQTARALLSD